jgi:hypothetical protein
VSLFRLDSLLKEGSVVEYCGVIVMIIIGWPQLSKCIAVVGGYLCYWADHSPPSNTEVKNEYICTLILTCAFIVFAVQLEIYLS